MADTSQKRALRNYRSRLTERGMARFEVLGLDADRELVRRLAEDGPEAAQVRETVSRTIAGERPSKGGILRALRRSPLLGAVFDIAGSGNAGRKVNLRDRALGVSPGAVTDEAAALRQVDTLVARMEADLDQAISALSATIARINAR